MRTVIGSRFPRKFACGCGFQIPRDPEVRYVVDLGSPRPYPAYLRGHSPDYGTYHGRPRANENAENLPSFVSASEFLRLEPPAKPPVAPRPTIEVAHEDAEAIASPEAGRPRASGQLVVNASQFESACSGFAGYARDGEGAKELRARVNRTILEDVEQKALAGRAIRAKPHGLSEVERVIAGAAGRQQGGRSTRYEQLEDWSWPAHARGRRGRKGRRNSWARDSGDG